MSKLTHGKLPAYPHVGMVTAPKKFSREQQASQLCQQARLPGGTMTRYHIIVQLRHYYVVVVVVSHTSTAVIIHMFISHTVSAYFAFDKALFRLLSLSFFLVLQ